MRNTTIYVHLIVGILLLSQTSSAQTQSHGVELELRPGKLVNGVPDTINFVFVNQGRKEFRVPPLSPCIGQYSGRLILHFQFSPAVPGGPFKGGGCGGGGDHSPVLFEQVKSWKKLEAGKSFTATYQRSELFAYEQAAGEYDFWGEYQPPVLSTEEIKMLENAGVSFLREPLTTIHLKFKRPR